MLKTSSPPPPQTWVILGLLIGWVLFPGLLRAEIDGHESAFTPLPYSLEHYEEEEAQEGMQTLREVLVHRVREHPFNLVATIIFICAITHTFLAGYIRKWAHRAEHDHQVRIVREGRTARAKGYADAKDDVSFRAVCLHFLGEVEAIFGIWVIPLLIAVAFHFGWDATATFITDKVHFTEPMVVVVIMAIASTRPVVKFSERALGRIAGLGGGTPAAWWLSILVVAPVLGSFITEPAAMTIAAILLAKLFYEYEPSNRLKYATIGLLFVNVSVGGTLTHFAAPPVLMVAGKWGWDMTFMFLHFGLKALVGIVVATLVYFWVFRREFALLQEKVRSKKDYGRSDLEEPVPGRITTVVLLFLAWTVFTLHHPPLFVGGFLFFLAFMQATATHQDSIQLKGPLLVGFFLAGLVIHGTLQNWWIAPVLSSLGEFELFFGATILPAFNDNAAITFLASQVPDFDPHVAGSVLAQERARLLEYAVVAGAVTGGGLTVIANAPNPAGQSILQRYFPGGVSPLGLFLGALLPTVIMGTCFMITEVLWK